MKKPFVFLLVFAGLSTLSVLEALPEWYPASYNLPEATCAVAEILSTQGTEENSQHPPPIRNIIFSDADHTLLKTQTPILLKDKKTGQLVKDPRTGKLLRLPNRSFMQAADRLKEKYPELPWDSFEMDFTEMGSIVAIDGTPPIDHIVSILRCAENHKTTREFIITARSSLSVPPALQEYFQNIGVHLDGVFVVNNSHIIEKFKLGGQGLSAAQMKAVIMAGIIQFYKRGGVLKTVSFYDDGDDNLQMAMELLPQLFSEIDFRFLDVVHVGGNRFSLKPVAYTCSPGKLCSEGCRKEMSSEDMRSYYSEDVPLPDEL